MSFISIILTDIESQLTTELGNNN